MVLYHSCLFCFYFILILISCFIFLHYIVIPLNATSIIMPFEKFFLLLFDSFRCIWVCPFIYESMWRKYDECKFIHYAHRFNSKQNLSSGGSFVLDDSIAREIIILIALFSCLRSIEGVVHCVDFDEFSWMLLHVIICVCDFCVRFLTLSKVLLLLWHIMQWHAIYINLHNNAVLFIFSLFFFFAMIWYDVTADKLHKIVVNDL